MKWMQRITTLFMLLVFMSIAIALCVGCAPLTDLQKEDRQHARRMEQAEQALCAYPDWWDSRSRRCRAVDTMIVW